LAEKKAESPETPTGKGTQLRPPPPLRKFDEKSPVAPVPEAKSTPIKLPNLRASSGVTITKVTNDEKEEDEEDVETQKIDFEEQGGDVEEDEGLGMTAPTPTSISEEGEVEEGEGDEEVAEEKEKKRTKSEELAKSAASSAKQPVSSANGSSSRKRELTASVMAAGRIHNSSSNEAVQMSYAIYAIFRKT
jgi:hypothetical protein